MGLSHMGAMNQVAVWELFDAEQEISQINITGSEAAFQLS